MNYVKPRAIAWGLFCYDLLAVSIPASFLALDGERVHR